MFKVKAKSLGYYDHKRRREGTVFHIEKKEDFSDRWMIDLEGKINAKKGSGNTVHVGANKPQAAGKPQAQDAKAKDAKESGDKGPTGNQSVI